MGYLFEELLRKFSEMYNETAGEHYTPREVIQLTVDLLLTGTAMLHSPRTRYQCGRCTTQPPARAGC